MKKLVLLVTAVCLILACAGAAYANDSPQSGRPTGKSQLSDVEWGEPVSVKTYYDFEVGDWVIEKSYIGTPSN